jgi:hypothetical protein
MRTYHWISLIESKVILFANKELRKLNCATSQKVAGPILNKINGFFNCPNPFSRTKALRVVQPPTEISDMNLLVFKARPGRKPDKLAAVCRLSGKCVLTSKKLLYPES